MNILIIVNFVWLIVTTAVLTYLYLRQVKFEKQVREFADGLPRLSLMGKLQIGAAFALALLVLKKLSGDKTGE